MLTFTSVLFSQYCSICFTSSKLKGVFSALKKEMSAFWSAFKEGQSLYAVRPSIIRGMERKSGYTDFATAKAPDEVTTVKDLVDSFKKQAGQDRLKYLREHYNLSDGEIAALGVTKSWTASTMVDGMGDNKVLEDFIKNHNLTNEQINDLFVLSKDEWVNKHVKELGDRAQEAAKKIENLSKASTVQNSDEYYKTATDVYKQTGNFDFAEAIFPGFKEKFEAELSEQTEEAKKTVPQTKGKDDKGVGASYVGHEIKDENWYTNSVTPGYISQEALDYQNEYFKTIEEDIFEDHYKHIREIDQWNPPTGTGILRDPTIGVSYVSPKMREIRGKEVKIPSSPMNEFFDNYLNSLPEFEELVSPETLLFTQFYQENKDELFTFRKTKADRKGDQVRTVLPISRIAEDMINQTFPNITEQEFATFDAGGGKTIGDLYKGTNLTKLYARFIAKLKETMTVYENFIREATGTLNEIASYPTLKELEADKFGKIHTKASLSKILTEQGIEHDMNKMKKGELLKLAAPYVADWESMNWNDFRAYAKSQGVSAKGSRAEIIERLNAKLSNSLSPQAQNWFDDYTEEEDLVKFKDKTTHVDDTPSGQVELNKLAASAEEFRQAAREQVEAARMQKEAAARRTQPPEVNYDYNEAREYSKRRKARLELEDMVTSSSDQVHETTSQRPRTKLSWYDLHPDYKEPGDRDYVPTVEDIHARRILEDIRKDRQLGLSMTDEDKFNARLQRKLDKAEEKFGSGSKTDLSGLSEKDYAENLNLLPRSYVTNTIEPTISEKVATATQNSLNKISTGIGGFFSGAKERLTRDRPGRMIGYAKATTGFQKMTNVVGNVTDLLGGPLMIAMEGATLIIQYINGLYQNYCEELQQASNQLKDAYSERESAEEGLKQLYREQNPDAEEEDVEQFVFDSYSQLYKDRHDNPEEWMKKTSQYLTDSSKYKQYEYDQEKDDGTYKEKEKEEDSYEEALRKNTSALYSATAQLDIAMNKLTGVMQDTWWGIDGRTGQLTDFFGYVQDHMFKNNGKGSNFTEEGSFLLTASQKDENYPGSKELAGLMLEDFHDAKGDWKKGLETLYGTDSKFLTDVMNESARTFLGDSKKGMANFASRLTPASRNRVQASI